MHARPVGEAGVVERLVEALVGLGEVDVLAHHGDRDLVLRVAGAMHDLLPGAQVRAPGPDVQHLGDLLVEALLVQDQRHLVDRLHVLGRHHGVLVHVAEEGDLGLDLLREEAVGAAQDDVRRDADRAQLLHRVLHRLGLELTGRRQIGHQCDVDEAAVLAPHLGPHLADGLEEGQRLDVAHGPADLGDQHVDALGGRVDARLDLVGHVRNHLDRTAQVVAPALLAEHRVVDPARGHVVELPHLGVAEALVVAQVEVRLGAVVGDVDLPVLEGIHRAGVDVQVGVQLEKGDAQPARLEQRPDRCRRQSLPQRGEHPPGDEDVLGRPRSSSSSPLHGRALQARRRAAADRSAARPPCADRHGVSNWIARGGTAAAWCVGDGAVAIDHRARPQLGGDQIVGRKPRPIEPGDADRSRSADREITDGQLCRALRPTGPEPGPTVLCIPSPAASIGLALVSRRPAPGSVKRKREAEPAFCVATALAAAHLGSDRQPYGA